MKPKESEAIKDLKEKNSVLRRSYLLIAAFILLFAYHYGSQFMETKGQLDEAMTNSRNIILQDHEYKDRAVIGLTPQGLLVTALDTEGAARVVLTITPDETDVTMNNSQGAPLIGFTVNGSEPILHLHKPETENVDQLRLTNLKLPTNFLGQDALVKTRLSGSNTQQGIDFLDEKGRLRVSLRVYQNKLDIDFLDANQVRTGFLVMQINESTLDLYDSQDFKRAQMSIKQGEGDFVVYGPEGFKRFAFKRGDSGPEMIFFNEKESVTEKLLISDADVALNLMEQAHATPETAVVELTDSMAY